MARTGLGVGHAHYVNSLSRGGIGKSIFRRGPGPIGVRRGRHDAGRQRDAAGGQHAIGHHPPAGQHTGDISRYRSVSCGVVAAFVGPRWHPLCSPIVPSPSCLRGHTRREPIAMHLIQPAAVSPSQVAHLLRVHLALWLVPAVIIAAAVGIYAAVYEATWEASQALIVRNEASNAERALGKFNYPEEMKTIQETMLEVVKSRSVLEAALSEVGPPAGCADREAWPTDRDIAAVRKNVKLAPPKGAEFGKTEVFYLNVRAEDRDRSVALNEAIFKQLQDPVPATPRRQGAEHGRPNSPRPFTWPRPTWTRPPPRWPRPRTAWAATWPNCVRCKTWPPATAPCAAAARTFAPAPRERHRREGQPGTAGRIGPSRTTIPAGLRPRRTGCWNRIPRCGG